MGIRAKPFDKTKASQNFDKVYNPEKISYKPFELRNVEQDSSLPPDSGKVVAIAATWIKKSMAQASDLPASDKCQMTAGGALFYKNLKKVNDNYYSIVQDSRSGICPHFSPGDVLYVFKSHFKFESC